MPSPCFPFAVAHQISIILMTLLPLLLAGCAAQRTTGSSRPGLLGTSGSSQTAPLPADLSAEVEFRDTNNNDFLDAEETDTLAVRLANHGRGRTSGLNLTVTAVPNLPQITFVTPTLPELARGDSALAFITLRAAKNLPDHSSESWNPVIYSCQRCHIDWSITGLLTE